MTPCVWSKMCLEDEYAYEYGYEYGHGHGNGHQRNYKLKHLSMTKLLDLRCLLSNHQNPDNADDN